MPRGRSRPRRRAGSNARSRPWRSAPIGQLLAAAPLGSAIQATGFLAAKSLRNAQLRLHVTNIEFLEGHENGIQTEENLSARIRRTAVRAACSSAASTAASRPRRSNEIDYKDVDLLKDFITENGKIMPARITGTSTGFQRQLSTAIKRARFLALMPYTDLH